MASERQVRANRRNGLKGGVKTEEGKAISRLNARKHSIFVTALTAEDSEEVQDYEDQLVASLRPAGRVEEMLVEKLALTWLRIQRCARAEAEYHGQIWKKLDDSWNQATFERLVKLIDLYDARLTNQFLKLLHEIERLQRLRKGENGTAAARSAGESHDSNTEIENAVKPPAASTDDAPAPAATETSCPPSQPLSFVPSPVADDLDEAGMPQPPEQALAPACDKSQDAAGQRSDAQEAI